MKATSCSGPQMNGTLSFASSLIGSTSSDNLLENFAKQLIIPIKDCTCFLLVGDGIDVIAATLSLLGLQLFVV